MTETAVVAAISVIPQNKDMTFRYASWTIIVPEMNPAGRIASVLETGVGIFYRLPVDKDLFVPNFYPVSLHSYDALDKVF